jgi:tRNA(Ile)-lysidine synthase
LQPIHNYSFKLDVPGSVKLPGNNFIVAEFGRKGRNWRVQAGKAEICFCDAVKVALPLKIRNRRNGDRFCPLGMESLKKVKDFFIDEKILAVS